MRLARVLAMLVVASCTRTVAPSAPRIVPYYAYDVAADKKWPPRTPIYDDAPVVVGAPFTVAGYWTKQCQKTDAPLTSKKDVPEYVLAEFECDRTDATVAIRCTGACTVRGDQITPTAAGSMTLEIELRAKDGKRRESVTRQVTAIDPDDLTISTCMPRTADGDRIRCAPSSHQIFLGVVGQDHNFIVPLLVNGRRLATHRPGVMVDLTELESTRTPGGDLELAVEFGTLKRVVVIGRYPKPAN